MRRASSADRVTVSVPARLAAPISQIADAIAGLPDPERVANALAVTASEAGRERAVLDALLPSPETMSDATVTQLRWNALAREEAIREFGALTSAQLADVRGSSTTNPHTSTGRWLAAGRVFAVDTPTGRLFPAFQFDERAEPRPVIARVLQALGGALRGWETLLWFTASSGQLDGARPVDRLDAPDDVVLAATYQAGLSED
jgi:hypothetical protein